MVLGSPTRLTTPLPMTSSQPKFTLIVLNRGDHSSSADAPTLPPHSQPCISHARVCWSACTLHTADHDYMRTHITGDFPSKKHSSFNQLSYSVWTIKQTMSYIYTCCVWRVIITKIDKAFLKASDLWRLESVTSDMFVSAGMFNSWLNKINRRETLKQFFCKTASYYTPKYIRIIRIRIFGWICWFTTYSF